MNRRTTQFGALLCLAAMAGFVAWPFWSWLSVKSASAALQERTKALVEKNCQLRPAWDIAMQDDVLTRAEAKIILEAGGEKVAPEE